MLRSRFRCDTSAFGHLDRRLGDVGTGLRVELVGDGVEPLDARAHVLDGGGLLGGALRDLRGGLRDLVGRLRGLLRHVRQLVLRDYEARRRLAGAADDLAEVFDHAREGAAERVRFRLGLRTSGQVAVGDLRGHRGHVPEVALHLGVGVGHVAELVVALDRDLLVQLTLRDAREASRDLRDAAGDVAREVEADRGADDDRRCDEDERERACRLVRAMRARGG